MPKHKRAINQPMMKACFADNAQVPIACSWDIDETYNCLIASKGIPRDQCQYWRPDMTVEMCRQILGSDWQLVKHEVICAQCGIRQDSAGSKEVAF